MKFLVSVLFLTSTLTYAADPAQDGSKPLWEYGIGLMHGRLEQYPSSDQYLNATLPFPTFQYRGEILRADDQEGARAYLVKDHLYSLELTGGGTPPVRSDRNDARQGMENIPTIVVLGPQVVFKLAPGLELKFSALQATSTDLVLTKFAGQVYESKIDYRWSTGYRHGGRARLTFSAASKQYLDHFYQVDSSETWMDRPAYDAQAGYHSTEFTYFHTYDVEKTTIFAGFTANEYSWSANKESPLFRTRQSLNYVAGLTYVLGESDRRSIPADQGDGLIEKIKRRSHRAIE